MGLPISSDMDGRVLTEVIDGNLLATRPIELIDVEGPAEGERLEFSKKDQETISERLRDLGYVD
jgi:hypothetical protein